MKKWEKAALITVLTGTLCMMLIFAGWKWYDANVDRSGWTKQDEACYYKDFHGRYVTGWQEIGGETYHFSSDGVMNTGWLEQENGRCYLAEDGSLCTGWLEIEGTRYYFSADGVMCTGWLEWEGRRCFFDDAGRLVTGWLDDGENRYYMDASGSAVTGWNSIAGQKYYFRADGSMMTGWAELEDGKHYFDDNGVMAVGWTDIGAQRYYFQSDGTMMTGWLREGERSYYLKDDGVMAIGQTQIDGQTCYFSPGGVYVLLVNPWNPLPEGYEVELTDLGNGYQVASLCYDSLRQMLEDCTAAGGSPKICSAYRTQGEQEYLFYRLYWKFRELGYGEESAYDNAATQVAKPGTSEHQLGLAVDIISSENGNLDHSQIWTFTQQWLMEHSWEYGFILRYPEEKTDITGIIFEPWHYRYVGTDIARELRELGICLEEYLGAENA